MDSLFGYPGPSRALGFRGGPLVGATFTRPSKKWAINSQGALVEYADSSAAFAGDSGGTRGVLIEEGRTNRIAGARCACTPGVIGSGGAWPSGWSHAGSGLVAAGGTVTLSNTTENDIPCIDVDVVGTSTDFRIFFVGNTTVAAAQNQIWSLSLFGRITRGALNTALQKAAIRSNASNGSGIAITTGSIALTGTLSRFELQNGAFASASTAYVIGYVGATSAGTPVDCTIRIGAPQLELGSFATSPVLPPVGTPGISVRSADALTIPLDGWFNPLQGTWIVECFGRPVGATLPRLIGYGGKANAPICAHSDGTAFSYYDGSQVNKTSNTFSTNAINRVASSYTSSGQLVCLNGGAVASAGNSYAAHTTAVIGSNDALSDFANVPIRMVSYYPRALSAEQLRLVTLA